MIVRKQNNVYTTHRKKVAGAGFMDTLKGIGSYIYQNKDLIAKPMLGAVGNVGALALTEATKAIIDKARHTRNDRKPNQLIGEDEEIIQRLLAPPTANIIGSGIKRY